MYDMYGVLKTVISTGGYKLAEIQYKIKKLYSLGDLDETQMDELLNLASTGISVDAERPEIQEMINTMFSEIRELKDRVKALEGGGGEEPQYPKWERWNGDPENKNYQNGAIVSHKSKLWLSDHPGQNVWEPGTPGTEAIWVEYTPAV